MISSPKMIELRPNRDLLDVNFEGYKLSLEPIPLYQHDFDCGVDHVLPNDDQYSYLHLKVFSLHNHLYGDPWHQEDVYFIDKRWRIQKNVVNPHSCRLEGLRQMWEIPASCSRQAGHYNPSLCFPNSEMAVVADGTGMIHIIVTGPRAECQPWKAIFSGEVCGTSQAFAIVDSRISKQGGSVKRELHCLLMWVEEVPLLEKLEKSEMQTRSNNFRSALSWIVLTEVADGNWSVLRSCHLVGSRELHYSALEVDCAALYVASEETVKFTEDSEKAVEPHETHNKEIKEGGDAEKKRYMWQQSVEGLEISFNVAADVQKSEIVVDVKDTNLLVTCRGRTLLGGDMWGRTDPSVSSWTYENCRLQVKLVKAENGLMWQSLIPTDSHGEEVLDPSLVEEVHQRLAHLCSDKEVTDNTHSPAFNSEQLEECDTGRTNCVLMRLDRASHAVSHQASLGGHQALFFTRTSASAVPALCLRHDVDGCVWQPSPLPPLDKTKWPIAHVGTFHAFGYVQASKQQRKFTVCAPDLSYVAVCDTSRHIYVYRQPADVQGSLRNRKTGHKVSQTAQQQLVTLGDTAEVLGAHAGNHSLFVITTNYILQLRVNS